jgi:hypothetical protein
MVTLVPIVTQSDSREGKNERTETSKAEILSRPSVAGSVEDPMPGLVINLHVDLWLTGYRQTAG